jgi:hypothetical protein
MISRLAIVILSFFAPLGAYGNEPLFETQRLFALTPKNKPNYRIPSIIQAPNGDILVICEKAQRRPGRHRQSRHRDEAQRGQGEDVER